MICTLHLILLGDMRSVFKILVGNFKERDYLDLSVGGQIILVRMSKKYM